VPLPEANGNSQERALTRFDRIRHSKGGNKPGEVRPLMQEAIGVVSIIPITQNQEKTFKGEEYLNLYPYVDEELVLNTKHRELGSTNLPTSMQSSVVR
jgi:hypothetical protein